MRHVKNVRVKQIKKRCEDNVNLCTVCCIQLQTVECVLQLQEAKL